MSASAITAAKHNIKNVATAAASSLPRPATPIPFLKVTFQRHPNPINATTHTFTEQASKDPTHPNYIAIGRRLAAFDPSILHWSVRASFGLAKKAAVRRWAVRRVREAFHAELRESGYHNDGRLLEATQGRHSLKGALLIQLDRNSGAVLANGKEIRMEARRVLDHVIGVVGRDTGLSNRTRDRGDGVMRRLSYKPGAQAKHGA